MNEAVQVITVITALVAVIVGPAVSLYIAKRQIRASVVSSSRQKWIDELRESIAGFMSEVNLASSIKHAGGTDERGLQAINRLLLLNHKIDLLINPNEIDHARLAELISEATNVMANGKGSVDDSTDAWDKRNSEITSLSQAILKREWVRVKQGL